MKLGVVGLGKLGLPLAAVLAEREHVVVGIDSDEKRVDTLRDGYSTIPEPEVQDLINRYASQLIFSSDPAWLHGSRIVFIVTPTPSAPDGAFSLDAVRAAVLEVVPYLKRDALLVVVSTVMPGHMRELAALVAGRCGLCYNPQFIALGSVVRDLRKPDFILIGTDEEDDGARLAEFYGEGTPVRVMDFLSAEVAKLALNCYVTMKISYANMLDELCGALGADVLAVTDAIGLDHRVGSAYLHPGTAYGGPCFPRDNAAFVQAARHAGVTALLPEATQATNTWQTGRLVQQIVASGARRVAVLGLAYKPGTPVCDESAGLTLAHVLLDAGLDVLAHDPLARAAGIPIAADVNQAIEWADALAVMTPWPEYRDLDRRGRRTFDPWRLYDGI